MKRIKTGFIPLILIFSLVLFTGCESDGKPDNLIPEDKYTELLLEVKIMENVIQMKNLEENRLSVLDSVFHHHDVTFEQFQKSHEYYQRQTEAQLQRIDKIRDKLREERRSLLEVRQELRESERERERLDPREIETETEIESQD